MKRIFTIIIMLVSLSSYGQQYGIDKKKFISTNDNYEFMVYYPVFTSGPNTEMLNKFVVDSYVKQNPVKKHDVDVKHASDFETMLIKSAEILKEQGLTKSIEPIIFKSFTNWHFYDNPKITSLVIDQYIIVGRDNILTSTSVINIDPSRGVAFNVKDYIIDTVDILNDIAVQFCKDKGLPQGASRLLTGLKYELANLPLPSEIGFSNTGVVFFYNRGELANIGFPPIRVEVPHNKILDNFEPSFIKNATYLSDGEKETHARLKHLVKDSKKVKKSPRR